MLDPSLDSASPGVLSIEPYTDAEEAAQPEQVAALLSLCDIFSPNESEAESIVGRGRCAGQAAAQGNVGRRAGRCITSVCNHILGPLW